MAPLPWDPWGRAPGPHPHGLPSLHRKWGDLEGNREGELVRDTDVRQWKGGGWREERQKEAHGVTPRQLQGDDVSPHLLCAPPPHAACTDALLCLLDGSKPWGPSQETGGEGEVLLASPQAPPPEVTTPVRWCSPHSHLGPQVEVASPLTPCSSPLPLDPRHCPARGPLSRSPLMKLKWACHLLLVRPQLTQGHPGLLTWRGQGLLWRRKALASDVGGLCPLKGHRARWGGAPLGAASCLHLGIPASWVPRVSLDSVAVVPRGRPSTDCRWCLGARPYF